MKLLVRDARPEDAVAIVAIFNPIIEAGSFTAFDTPFTPEVERSYIASLPERAIFHVAVHTVDHTVVGFQSMEPFATYTHAFDHVGVLGTYVDLKHRRHGVAKCLFRATFEAARRKGYDKILTYIRADNPAALSTYLNHGFRIVGTAERQAKLRRRYVDEGHRRASPVNGGLSVSAVSPNKALKLTPRLKHGRLAARDRLPMISKRPSKRVLYSDCLSQGARL